MNRVFVADLLQESDLRGLVEVDVRRPVNGARPVIDPPEPAEEPKLSLGLGQGQCEIDVLGDPCIYGSRRRGCRQEEIAESREKRRLRRTQELRLPSDRRGGHGGC